MVMNEQEERDMFRAAFEPRFVIWITDNYGALFYKKSRLQLR
jgi:hypothetical protein